MLSLIYVWKDIVTARCAIEAGDRRTRASGLEYLDNLLKGSIRARVMPILEDATMDDQARRASVARKSRPRDLEDTLAQLVHDDDEIVAAAAIHFVEQRQLWSMVDDLEFVKGHRSSRERYVVEAALWALAARRLALHVPRDRWMEPMPTVELADRIRKIPLFDFVSVDELFRIADTGRQVRHEPGRELYHEGAPPDDVQFLLDGSVHVTSAAPSPDDNGPSFQVEAPAALAFEEILQGIPSPVTITAAHAAICLALGKDNFLTMLSDNIVVAKGLFRMLLDTPNARQWRTVYVPLRAEAVAPRNPPLQPLDKVLLLRQNPLLARATVNQLLDLVRITREVPLTAGTVLFDLSDEPSLYHIIEGEVLLEADGSAPIVARPGTTIGVAEVLASVPLGRRAVVTRAGQALRLTHDELFDVLADHIDLLQSLFSGLLTASQPSTRGEGTAAAVHRGIAV
jgi:CRP-like cAMP-binding protein